MRCAIPLLLAAGAAAAQDPMTAEEFEAYSEGRILSYALGPLPYGAEAHGPERQVLWTTFDGECFEGVWFPRGDDICFLYESGIEGERCWRFERGPGGLRGEITSDPADERSYRVAPTDVPLDCPTPWLGARAPAEEPRPAGGARTPPRVGLAAGP